MGVSLCQWRLSVGMFNAMNLGKGCGKESNSPLIDVLLSDILASVRGHVSLKILLGLFKFFAYSFMIVSLLPIFLMLYPYLNLFWDNTRDISFQEVWPLANYIVFAFFKITLFPFDLYEIFRHVSVLSRFTLPEKLKNVIFFVSVLQVLLFISGAVELNPGPVSPQKKLSFAVWNLGSFPARDFARIPLIESLQNINDMLGVCESMLTSNILNEDIYINGFSPEPFGSDKGLNTRNGGVCLYFKESLPIKERRDLQIIPETIVAEIKLNRKKMFVVLSYCHPNISIGEFNEYLNSLEKMYESIRKENSYVSILCGDFNAKSPLFWEGNSENRQGRLLNNFLISNNLEQLISEPTQVRDDGSMSFIDLICTDQPFLFTETGVLSSLDHHSRHNIIHGTINISVPRPPPFKRLNKSRLTSSR